MKTVKEFYKEFEKNKEWGRNLMETLYEVIVVSKKREVILDEKVVGKNEDEAKFTAGVSEALKSRNMRISDVTIICNVLGEVAIKKEPERVKIIKEGEDV